MRFVFASLSLIGHVAAHGAVTSPVARASGPAQLAVCGSGPTTYLAADINNPIENAVAKKGADYTAACDLFLCKGYQLSDNTAHVQTYSAGTVVPMTAFMKVHHTGTANVSVVETASRSLIGDPLIYWPTYSDDTATSWPANETAWEVTIPDLGPTCSEPGACVLQWWWWSPKAKQSYESCVDFVQPVAE